jgi:cyclohexa-1,5-dienecarbonyl-CoA hydratase
MSAGLRVLTEGPVARITLDRPPLNVLTTAMMRGLADALDAASHEQGVRLVRIDAVGRAFCAGVDVGEHLGDALHPMIEALGNLFETLARTPLVTVAVVHAAALGGGCELVMGADLCVAAEGAVLGQPEIKLGVFAPPASVLLPRLVGERRALGMLLSGDPVPAREARAIAGSQRSFCASEPQVKMGHITSDPCTETNERRPESPRSSSCMMRPLATGPRPAHS